MMIKQVSNLLHPKMKEKIVTAVCHLSIGNKVLEWYDRQTTDVYFLSFPKCGRTWLRLMLGKAFALYLDTDKTDLLNLKQFSKICPEIPAIKTDHDHDIHFKTPDELSTVKTEYAGKKVILLVRDVRDVAVSSYFEYTRRRRQHVNRFSSPYYEGSISSFLRHPVGSVDTFIHFYNIWAMNRNIPESFMLIRYEDLHKNSAYELRRVLDFLGLPDISDKIVHEAVEYTRFERMRKRERAEAIESSALRPADKDDPESYKTRKGKVGGFADYLTQADIDFLNQKMKELSSYYEYR